MPLVSGKSNRVVSANIRELKASGTANQAGRGDRAQGGGKEQEEVKRLMLRPALITMRPVHLSNCATLELTFHLPEHVARYVMAWWSGAGEGQLFLMEPEPDKVVMGTQSEWFEWDEPRVE